jgi:glutathionyl-hydroquinone reductase
MTSNPKTALDEMAGGNFKRSDASFREMSIEPEAGRYHLYVSYAW